MVRFPNWSFFRVLSGMDRSGHVDLVKTELSMNSFWFKVQQWRINQYTVLSYFLCKRTLISSQKKEKHWHNLELLLHHWHGTFTTKNVDPSSLKHSLHLRWWLFDVWWAAVYQANCTSSQTPAQHPLTRQSLISFFARFPLCRTVDSVAANLRLKIGLWRFEQDNLDMKIRWTDGLIIFSILSIWNTVGGFQQSKIQFLRKIILDCTVLI